MQLSAIFVSMEGVTVAMKDWKNTEAKTQQQQ